jgi:hypothetical protein
MEKPSNEPTAETMAVGRIWTTDDDGKEIPLDAAIDHSVYFQTNAGIITVYKVGDGVTVGTLEYPFELIVKPESTQDIFVTVNGWQEKPQPGEACAKCGSEAEVVYVWKSDGERVASCGRQCPREDPFFPRQRLVYESIVEASEASA